MNDSGPVFIADTCIGGLSVVKAMWGAGYAGEAFFMADYAVNPLGVKSDAEIAGVVNKWLTAAEAYSDTLVIACNTLSIRYHQLRRFDVANSGLKHVVSMVDCFDALVRIEAERLANSNILIIGTEFTANQSVYPDILAAAVPGVGIKTIGATDLERQIARFELRECDSDSMLSRELEMAIEKADIAVLACTCFPMVRDRLESRFPGTIFLDPGAYCSGLIKRGIDTRDRKLSISVTGGLVSKKRVVEFAKSYLGNDAVV